jgi:hypothetical protein
LERLFGYGTTPTPLQRLQWFSALITVSAPIDSAFVEQPLALGRVVLSATFKIERDYENDPELRRNGDAFGSNCAAGSGPRSGRQSKRHLRGQVGHHFHRKRVAEAVSPDNSMA